MFFTLSAIGCRGPEGPAGIDAAGVDILPPTLQMTEPWPLGQYWDVLNISAASVDNVAVDRVIFTLDGSTAIDSYTMTSSTPPYRFNLPLTNVSSGWHFVGARAYDLAGNTTEAPPRPVWVGHSSSLSDTTVSLAYHNEKIGTVFSIPDTARAEAFWVRVTPAKGGTLRSVTFQLGGVFSDTAEVQVGLWTGSSIPDDEETTQSLPSGLIERDIKPIQLFFTEDQDTLTGEFFIVLSLLKKSSTDTLRIAADNGAPPWGRSGIRDDGGWQTTTERYGLAANLIATMEFYYAPIPTDTTGE